MTSRRQDRYVFGLAHDNTENYEYWRRSLRLAAMKNNESRQLIPTSNSSNHSSPKKSPAGVGYGHQYRANLEEALNPVKLSFSLKPKTRPVDQSKARLDKYCAERRTEIVTEPTSVLDAPGLRDDYYLNILDWSAQNLLAVALNEAVYVWDAERDAVRLLTQVDCSFDYISSLAFSADGGLLNLASSQGCLSIFDIHADRKVRDYMLKDTGRLACMTMSPSGAESEDGCLTVGSKSGAILHFDPRDSGRTPALVLREHSLEVCGLRRGFDAKQIASGGNDNKVCIWDLRWPEEPFWVQSDHLAAVKALDWCPWQRSLLATGAGTADRRIRFWNTLTNSCQREIQCESQVCGLRWSASHAEIVSTHGFGTNELALWHYPSLERIASVRAHDSRVLQATLSADGTTLVTAAANEHLKFWELFPARPALRRPRSL